MIRQPLLMGGGGDKKSACQYYRRVMSGERWVMRVVGGL